MSRSCRRYRMKSPHMQVIFPIDQAPESCNLEMFTFRSYGGTMARAGRKPSANAKRRQTTRAGQGRIAEDKGTEELCGHKRAATGRTDLPIEPLGVLYGRGKIEEAEYRAGQRLEAARRATFGHDTAAPRTIYGDRLARGVAGQWAAQQIAAADVSEETQRREARAEAEYERLLQTLHRCQALCRRLDRRGGGESRPPLDSAT